MKKAFAFLSIICLVALVFVSCNSETKLDDTITVRFKASDSRSLSVSNQNLVSVDSTDLQWYYHGWKISDDKFTTGQSGSDSEDNGSYWTPLETLDQTVEFSQGLWNFKLKALRKTDDAQLYSGETNGDVLLSKANEVNTIQISVSPISSSNGNIVFSGVYIDPENSEEKVSPNKIIIDGSIEITAKNDNNPNGFEIGADGKISLTYSISAGTHTVKVLYESSQEGVVIASEEKTIIVYSGLNTTISGSVEESTTTGKFVVPTLFEKQIKVDETSVSDTTARVNEDVELSNSDLTVTIPADTIITLDSSNSISEDKKTADAKIGVSYVGDSLSEVSKDNNISIQDDEGSVDHYDLCLNVAENNSTLVTVQMKVKPNLAISRVLHNGEEIMDNDTKEEGDEYYEYNTNGTLTLHVYHASPIEIITVKPDIVVTVDGEPMAFYIAGYAEEVNEWNAGTYVNEVNGWDINAEGGPFNAEYVALCHAFWAASNGLGNVETSIVLNTDLETQGKYYSGIFRSDEEGTFTQYGHTAMKYFAEIPDVTLDLNGHTINMDATSSSGSAISVYNANLTIKDSVGGGGISSHCYSTLCHLGNTVITLEGGTFTTDATNGNYHGMAIMSGGDFVENATADGYMPGEIIMHGGTFTFDYMDGKGGTPESPATVKQHYSSYPQRYEGYDENTPVGVFFYLEDGEIPEGYTYIDNGNGTFTVVPATNE